MAIKVFRGDVNDPSRAVVTIGRDRNKERAKKEYAKASTQFKALEPVGGWSKIAGAIADPYFRSIADDKDRQAREAAAAALEGRPFLQQLAMSGKSDEAFAAAARQRDEQARYDRKLERSDFEYKRSRKDALEDRKYNEQKAIQKAIQAEREYQKKRQDRIEDKLLYERLKRQQTAGAATGVEAHPDLRLNAGMKPSAGADKEIVESLADSSRTLTAIDGFDKAYAGLGRGWPILAEAGLTFAKRGWEDLAKIAADPKANTDMRAAAEFWMNYRMLDELPTRHKLFGSALTATENKSWRSATITPEMDPELVAKNIEMRKELLLRGNARMLLMTINKFDAGRELANANFGLGLSPEQLRGYSNSQIVDHFLQQQGQLWGVNLTTEDLGRKPGTKKKPETVMGVPVAPAAPAEVAPAPAAAPSQSDRRKAKAASTTPPMKLPPVGTVVSGMRYIGGNPKLESSWEKAE